MPRFRRAASRLDMPGAFAVSNEWLAKEGLHMAFGGATTACANSYARMPIQVVQSSVTDVKPDRSSGFSHALPVHRRGSSQCVRHQ